MDRLDVHLRRKGAHDERLAACGRRRSGGADHAHLRRAARARVQGLDNPDEVAAWFGPGHVDTPRERIRIDLRVGGRYELTMVRRDGGGEFAIGYDIVELVPPELLVLRSDPMPEVGIPVRTVVRIELHDHGARTRMTLSDGLYPPAARGHAEAGWSAAFDKLATLVKA